MNNLFHGVDITKCMWCESKTLQPHTKSVIFHMTDGSVHTLDDLSKEDALAVIEEFTVAKNRLMSRAHPSIRKVSI